MSYLQFNTTTMSNKTSKTHSNIFFKYFDDICLKPFRQYPAHILSEMSMYGMVLMPISSIFKWINIESFLAFNPYSLVGHNIVYTSLLKPSTFQLLSTVFSGFCPNPIAIQSINGPLLLSSVNWTPLSKCLGLASDIITMIPLLLIVFYIRKIAMQFIAGNCFSMNQSRYYHTAGWLVLLQAIITGPIGSLLLSYATTINNSRVFYPIIESSGTFNLLLFIGIILMMIAQMIDRAADLEIEHDSTI